MAEPVLNGSGTSVSGGGITIHLDTNIPAGHFAVVDIVYDTSSASVPSSLTVHAGSTQLGSTSTAPTHGNVAIRRFVGTVGAGGASRVEISGGQAPYVALVYGFVGGTTIIAQQSVNNGSSSPAQASGTISGGGNTAIAIIGMATQGGGESGSMTKFGSVVSSPTGAGFAGRIYYQEGDGGDNGSANVGFGGSHDWISVFSPFNVPPPPVELHVAPGAMSTEGAPMELETFPPVILNVPPGELTTAGVPMAITKHEFPAELQTAVMSRSDATASVLEPSDLTAHPRSQSSVQAGPLKVVEDVGADVESVSNVGAVLRVTIGIPATAVQSRSMVEDSLLFPSDLTAHIRSTSKVGAVLDVIDVLKAAIVSRSIADASVLEPSDLTCHIRSQSAVSVVIPMKVDLTETEIQSVSELVARLIVVLPPAVIDVDPPSQSFVLASIPQEAPEPPQSHPAPPTKDCDRFRFPVQAENTQVKIVIRNPYPTYSDVAGLDWTGLWTRIQRKV